MKFAIITHATHKKQDKKYFAYEPYVREMNLWSNYVDQVLILAPKSLEKITPIEISYHHSKIDFLEVPNFNVTSIKNTLKSMYIIPIIVWKLFLIMKKADHIHLRCPGNIGLLACFVQLFFPDKPKTVKYAGNWDPNSNQPLSYRLQKWIVSTPFLTRNCSVLVYGNWKNQSKNIVPFFTASYTNDEIEETAKKNFKKSINFIYVGTFSKGKQPLLSVKIIERLKKENFSVVLNMYGNGTEFNTVETYIVNNKLNDIVFLHGNQPKEIIKKAYLKSHFLILLSKSEGWPKVVAEAMFWGCLPISFPISSVPYMLDYGNRGILVNNYNSKDIVNTIIPLLTDEVLYLTKVQKAKKWAQNFTLNRFSKEIKEFLQND